MTTTKLKTQLFLPFMMYKATVLKKGGERCLKYCPASNNNTKCGNKSSYCLQLLFFLLSTEYSGLLCILSAAVVCVFLAGLRSRMHRTDKLSWTSIAITGTALPCSFYFQWPGRVTSISIIIKFLLLTQFRGAGLRDELSLCWVTNKWRGKKDKKSHSTKTA